MSRLNLKKKLGYPHSGDSGDMTLLPDVTKTGRVAAYRRVAQFNLHATSPGKVWFT